MGTSLSGLTPATTFDGLLKTSDNEPLDGTLKAISTGDGTDTILQLSNSALSIGGATTIVSDNIGSDSPFLINTSSTGLLKVLNTNSAITPMLSVGHGTQDTAITYYTRIGFRASGSVIAEMTSSEVRVGGGSGARLAVKGSGATSATTSLLVQNSAGTQALKVTDDGAIDFGAIGLEFSNDGSGGTMSVASDRYVKIASSLNTYSALNAHVFKTLDGSAYSEAMRITGNTDQFVGIGESTPTAKLHIKGDGTGTADYSFRVQNAIGNNNMQIRDDGAVFLTNNRYTFNAAGGAVLKGSGATSATTALLVQNSAGADMLKVQDDGLVNIIGTNNDYNTVNFQIQRSTGESIFRARNRGALEIGSGIDWISLNSSGNGVRLNVSNSEIARVTASGVGIGETTPTARLHIKGSGNDNTTTALLVQNSDGDDMMVLDDNKEVSFKGRSGFYNGVFIVENNHTKTQGNAIFGAFATPTARLHIKGSGATSATTALLVQNSAGTDLMKVRDDNVLVLNNGNYSFSSSQATFGKKLAIGVTANQSSAVFEIASTTQGFLPPRMTTTQRDAISTPASGLMVYNTTTNKAQCYNGTAWQDLF